MAEEIPQKTDPAMEAIEQDDVLGKIDQLLNRHRPKSSSADAIPVLLDTTAVHDVAPGDGIPVLTDVVGAPGRAETPRPASSRSKAGISLQIVRRMSLALDSEHARLTAQLAGDGAQMRMLDRLVIELKRALPAAVRAAVEDKTVANVRPRGDSPL